MNDRSSTEALHAELCRIRIQLDAYPFRHSNKRLHAILKSQEGRQFSQETRTRLEQSIVQTILDALHADPEVERLLFRECEIEMLLERRQKELNHNWEMESDSTPSSREKGVETMIACAFVLFCVVANFGICFFYMYIHGYRPDDRYEARRSKSDEGNGDGADIAAWSS